MRLLVTRPVADAERTAAALAVAGHAAAIAPLISIEAVADAPVEAERWAAILITSANAAHGIRMHRRREALRGIPVFAVGDHSAQAMREAGFPDVTSARGDVAGLAGLVGVRARAGDRLLYLAGEERSGDLAGDLGRQGFVVHTIVVYRAVPAAVLPQAAVDALALGLDGVLHFSRRAADAYINAAAGAGLLARALAPLQFCLSARIAEPLLGAGATRVHIARQPNEAALIELIGWSAR